MRSPASASPAVADSIYAVAGGCGRCNCSRADLYAPPPTFNVNWALPNLCTGAPPPPPILKIALTPVSGGGPSFRDFWVRPLVTPLPFLNFENHSYAGAEDNNFSPDKMPKKAIMIISGNIHKRQLQEQKAKCVLKMGL